MEVRERFYRARAWSVHLYTSLGLIASFMALAALVAGHPQRFFIYLGIALFIDATDGTLARRWQVKKWAANFDGRKLDDITDYINYAFLPIFFTYRAGLVTGGLWVGILMVCLLAAAYGFCQGGAKTNDGFFTGFPNFWNLVVFYLYLLKPPEAVAGLIFLILAALIWVPVKYISFSTVPLRGLTLALCAVYGVMLGFLVAQLEAPNPLLVVGSLLVPIYYVAASIYLTVKERTKQDREQPAFGG